MHLFQLKGINFQYVILFSGKPLQLFQSENPDWIPSICMGHNKTAPSPIIAKERHHSLKERGEKKELYSAAEGLIALESKRIIERQKIFSQEDPLPPASDEINNGMDGASSEKMNTSNCSSSHLNDSSTQTEITATNFSNLEEELKHLNGELYELRKQNAKLKVGAPEWFEGKDEKVTFYTGLPSINILMVLFNFLTGALPHTVNTALTPFQELVLTLMRLRLNLTLNDIAYRFSISKTTASSVFLRWLDIMFVKLAPLIKWPERDPLWETTPLSFRKHFKTKVVIIIDCFEVFINKPSNLLARATTWSQYKHHNTAKFLIGNKSTRCHSIYFKSLGRKSK